MRTFVEIYDSMKDTLEYQVEELSLTFTESVLMRMEELDDLSPSALAIRMGISKPYVSKLLKGKSNFTLETLVKLAHALECRIASPTLIPNAKPATARVILFTRSPKPDPSAFYSTTRVSEKGLAIGNPNDDTASDTAAA